MSVYKKGQYIEIGMGEYDEGSEEVEDGQSLFLLVDVKEVEEDSLVEFFEKVDNVLYIQEVTDSQSIDWANHNQPLSSLFKEKSPQERKQVIQKDVDTREKLIEFIVNGDFEGDNNDGEIWNRYDIQIFEKNKCITTRISKEENHFSIDILIQHDHDYGQYPPYDYLDGHWEDIERVTYITGFIDQIEQVMTEEIYQGLFQELNDRLTKALVDESK